MQDIDFNNIRRMDGSLLLVFHELLREKRATTVAERLGLSQSAISHALTRLREIFGDPLFVRKPHGLAPTRRALELGPQVEALLQLADSTLARERKFEPKESGRRFIVSAPEFVTALMGARLIETFRKQAPKAQIILESLQRDVAFQALRRGEIDLAIGLFDSVGLGNGLARELLFEDRYCAIARKGHPLVKGKLSMGAYAEIGHVYALREDNEDTGGDAGDVWMRGAVPRWLTVLMLVAGSDAIGTVPLALAERHAKTLKLQVIRAPFLQDRIRVSAVRRSVKDAGADWFFDQVKTAVK